MLPVMVNTCHIPEKKSVITNWSDILGNWLLFCLTGSRKTKSQHRGGVHVSECEWVCVCV